ncbi:murein biosynthesis integral membrane protein MurJ [Microbacterium sp. cx-55]|uniref:murein biosynthesis integral membrane protein MurJ n=1 Tax=Microbacterium sp. cx-55 TaxID=2875948 RepID=UPI001CC11591|nr:murein biosynthesis integral membrane protein MurJ [Microbacterium sp. cx-55]MBZ4487176.1 murein biosynthesis integral membrane protein MurJ [Microbacterium sp. cx-55]UGB35204.1 murein biosynthesis integral membrane protein MurJ [Microbacterium sp. cx-55]
MSGLGRASVLLGAGTMVSRVSGLIRTIVLVGVIGSIASPAADAFALANQLPNNVYAIISAGVLTAVIVPQIVRESARSDGGQRFISALFTAGVVVLLAVTAVVTLAAPLLISLYADNFTPEQQALATAFAYWCLPQIFFYGLYSLLGETLNARRIFGPFTWAPVVNNVVSIAGFLAIAFVFGSDLTRVDDWTPGMVALLGGTATIGIAVQALILLVFWRRTGLHLRPDFRWRGLGFRNMGRLAGWTAAMVVVGQIAGLVQTRVVADASGVGASVAATGNAWLIFMLPYSVIVLSIGTPYFTQISEHASAGRDSDVRTDVARSIRIISLFIVIAAAAIAVAAVPASRIFTNSEADAVAAAPVLLAYLVSLLPLSVLFIVQRTFYAYDDTRTPFVFTAIQGVLVVVTAVVAGWILPNTWLAAGVALGQSLAITVQVLLATWLLRRRLGRLGIASWITAIVRYVIAAVPAAAAGWGVYLLLGGDDGWTTTDKIFGALGTGIIGLTSLVAYFAVLAALRTPELAPALGMLRRILPGR